jgi:iron-sulfur cluster repair protein YtfE (RIC family)
VSDVVDVLLEQHEEIRAQFARVMGAEGHAKVEAFALLAALMDRHERIEQEIVHPALAAADPDAAAGVVADVVTEERDADRTVTELVLLGPNDPAFNGMLADLHAAVVAHAAHEEEQEFPLLRDRLTDDARTSMASQVRKAAAEGW